VTYLGFEYTALDVFLLGFALGGIICRAVTRKRGG